MTGAAHDDSELEDGALEETELEDTELDAGGFAAWIDDTQRAIRGERSAEVPCAGCTACCKASQFVHIGPDETDTLSHIPAELLFPAPLMPRGHVLLGYDERGHCRMLVDDQCSIYEHRPRTCRTYDCRVFPATQVAVDDREKALIAQRVARWRFRFPARLDRVRHDAARAAARYLVEHRDRFPDAALPTTATARAVLAIEIHELFLERDEATDEFAVVDPDPEVVRAEVLRRSPPRGRVSRGR